MFKITGTVPEVSEQFITDKRDGRIVSKTSLNNPDSRMSDKQDVSFKYETVLSKTRSDIGSN